MKWNTKKIGSCQVKLANNTFLQYDSDRDVFDVRLYDTNVVTVARGTDGCSLYRVSTGGHYTMTTKDRINRFSSLYLTAQHMLWLAYRVEGDEVVPLGLFRDGMQVGENGTVYWPGKLQDMGAAIGVSRRLKVFRKKFLEAVGGEHVAQAALLPPNSRVSCEELLHVLISGVPTAEAVFTLGSGGSLESLSKPVIDLVVLRMKQRMRAYWPEWVTSILDHDVQLPKRKGKPRVRRLHVRYPLGIDIDDMMI